LILNKTARLTSSKTFKSVKIRQLVITEGRTDTHTHTHRHVDAISLLYFSNRIYNNITFRKSLEFMIQCIYISLPLIGQMNSRDVSEINDHTPSERLNSKQSI